MNTKTHLSIDEYQSMAANVAADRTLNIINVINYGLGICGEFGEVADIIKKVVGQGHDLNASLDKLTSELGDCIWYSSMFAYINGVPLSTLVLAESFDELNYFNADSEPRVLELAKLIFDTQKFIHKLSTHMSHLIDTQSLVDYDKMFVNTCISNLMFSISAIADELHLSLATIAFKNHEKLRARFPNGFSTEASVNRHS